MPVDRYDYGWDPYEREEAVWRDPTSRNQIYIGDNTDIVPLDEQEILTDREEDTADPQYFPGRRRAEELDPDQSDIEDQFLSRVRPPSATRTVHLAEEGAAPRAPAEESTAGIKKPHLQTGSGLIPCINALKNTSRRSTWSPNS